MLKFAKVGGIGSCFVSKPLLTVRVKTNHVAMIDRVQFDHGVKVQPEEFNRKCRSCGASQDYDLPVGFFLTNDGNMTFSQSLEMIPQFFHRPLTLSESLALAEAPTELFADVRAFVHKRLQKHCRHGQILTAREVSMPILGTCMDGTMIVEMDRVPTPKQVVLIPFLRKCLNGDHPDSHETMPVTDMGVDRMHRMWLMPVTPMS